MTLAALLGGLIVLGFVVLRPFLASIAWALVAAYATWPAYARLRSLLRGNASLGALIMTAFFAVALVVPLMGLTMSLAHEIVQINTGAEAWFAHAPQRLAQMVGKTPLIGGALQAMTEQLLLRPPALQAQLAQWSKEWLGQIASMVGGIGRNALKFSLATLTLFFVYRDGERLLNEVRRLCRPIFGTRLDSYLAGVGDVTRSVVYGIVLTAIAQGLLAGLGYWVAGARAPLLLSIMTMIAALLPFGSPFVWVPVGVGLVVSGNGWAGAGLLIWGTLVVSWADNIIRPLVISNVARIPFLLVVFGILGGIVAFGLIGVFIGPFVISTLLTIWREWQAETKSVN